MHDSAPDSHPIILDSTVLSSFAVCGQISLLERFFQGRAFTTLMVVDEIKKGIAAGYDYLEVVETILAPMNRDGWLITLSLDTADEQQRYIELLAACRRDKHFNNMNGRTGPN